MAKQAAKHNTTDQSDFEKLAELDPVVKLTIFAEALHVDIEDMEKKRFTKAGKKSGADDEAPDAYLENAEQDAIDRLGKLEDYATTLQARSPAGALAHLRLLMKAVMSPPDEDASDYEKRVHNKTVLRLIFSIDGVLTSQVPEKLCEAIPHGNSHMNPWVPYDERWAAVKLA